MNIVFLTHSFPPEHGGDSTMTYELARYLVQTGYQVTVVATFAQQQHHMAAGNSHNFEVNGMMDGINVIRIKSPNLKISSFVQRALKDFIEEIGLFMKGLNCGPIDIIFVMSPPITLPIFAFILKIIRKSILVLNVQDIFPEMLEGMGIVGKRNILFLLGELIEKQAYWGADYIGVHSPKNRLHVISRGVSEKKVNVMPMWIDTDKLSPRPKNNEFSKRYGLESKFVVMYAGTVGFAMDATIIPRVASLISEEKNIQFIVVGGGNRMDVMKEEIEKLRVKNILLLPPQPQEELPNVLAAADILLVLLRRELSDNPNGYFQAVVPHKLLSCMASERPIIVSAEEESDTAKLVNLSKCGVVTPVEDSHALSKAVMQLKKDQELLQDLGQNGRKFVCKHFNSKTQVARFEIILRHLLERNIDQLNNPWNEAG
jgi:colanic acid biosynthesis glycosyl transferase WcaI